MAKAGGFMGMPMGMPIMPKGGFTKPSEARKLE